MDFSQMINSVPYEAIGKLMASLFAVKVLVLLYKFFLRPSKSLRKMGEWAVVTGATDGIGKAYAFKLAKEGLNVLLISRTKSKLDDVAREITDKHGVECSVLAIDFSDFNDDCQDKIAKACKNLDVGVLINNVGVSYPFPKYFTELTRDEVFGLMEMNISSTTYMTHTILPSMMEKKRGAIVNIASAAGTQNMPLLAQYSAAKAYVCYLSRGLAVECASKNVTIQTQVPFYVATKLAKLRESFTVPSPKAYVDLASRWIGHGGDVVVSPFWPHALQGWVLDCLPNFITDGIVNSMHHGIRKRGMKKAAMKKA